MITRIAKEDVIKHMAILNSVGNHVRELSTNIEGSTYYTAKESCRIAMAINKIFDAINDARDIIISTTN